MNIKILYLHLKLKINIKMLYIINNNNFIINLEGDKMLCKLKWKLKLILFDIIDKKIYIFFPS